MAILASGRAELEIRSVVSPRGQIVHALDLRWAGRSLLPASVLDKPAAAVFRDIPPGWLSVYDEDDPSLGNTIAYAVDLRPGDVSVWRSAATMHPKVTMSLEGCETEAPQTRLRFAIDGSSLVESTDRRGFVRDDLNVIEASYAIVAPTEAVARFGREINVAWMPAWARWRHEHRTDAEVALETPSEPIIERPGCFPFAFTVKSRLWAERIGYGDALPATAIGEISRLWNDMIDPDRAEDDPDQITLADLYFHFFDCAGWEFLCAPGELNGRSILVVDCMGLSS